MRSIRVIRVPFLRSRLTVHFSRLLEPALDLFLQAAFFFVLPHQVTIGLQRLDVIADDLEHTKQGNSEDHTGNAPQKFAGDDARDGEERIEGHTCTDNKRLEDVGLDELHQEVSAEDAHYQRR